MIILSLVLLLAFEHCAAFTDSEYQSDSPCQEIMADFDEVRNLLRSIQLTGIKDNLKTKDNLSIAAKALTMLNHITSVAVRCGDAWYYRGKAEELLGLTNDAEYSFKYAKEFNSTAYKNRIDPFKPDTNKPIIKAAARFGLHEETQPFRADSEVISSPQSVNENIIISGEIVDESVVSSVTIDGDAIALTKDNTFEVKLKRKNLESKYVITANDIYGNSEKYILTLDLPVQMNNINTTEVNYTAIGEYYALLISVQNYKDDNIQDLSKPHGDSQRLRDVLINNYTFQNNNIITLIDPTRSDVLRTLDALSKKLTNNDSLLIFYAGHGKWKKENGQGYWWPADAEKDNSSNWISNSDLRDNIKSISAKHVLLITDACFSGSIFRSDRNDDDTKAVDRISKSRSRKAITSGALEKVPDQSVFIEKLLAHLKYNDNNVIFALELYSNVKRSVINDSPVEQNPLYGIIIGTGDEDGDFSFRKRISGVKLQK
jgi:hypothetical protein